MKTAEPMPPKLDPQASQHHFINRALSFTLWENLFKPISPLLELTCAGLFVGGAWGRFKFYESLTILLFRISLMGMDKGVIWFYSQVEEKVYLKAVFRGMTWCLIAFVVLSLLAAAGHYGWIPFITWGKNSQEFSTSDAGFLFYLAAVPMLLLIELCVLANVNKKSLKYRILIQGIALPLLVYGPAIAGKFLAPEVFTLPLCYFAGNAVAAALAMWSFLRTHRPTWQDVSLAVPPPWKMVRYSFPLAAANVFSALAVRLDIFMLAGMTGVKSVEIYTVVSMIGKALTSIRQSFENILLSSFSSSGMGKLTLKLKHYFNYAVWLVMNIQGTLLALALFFGGEILGLVDHQYAAGYWVLVATAFFVYINTVSDFAVLLALGLGRTHIAPVTQVIFFCVNMGLNILLIPRWDAVGAAAALGLANLTAGIMYLAYLAFTYKVNPLAREYWLSIFAAALLLGLPAAWVIHAGAGAPVKAVCFAIGIGAVFWMQRAWYARFNRVLHALPAEGQGEAAR